MGDSVVNGGNSTDQAELATALVRKTLAASRQNTVHVLNVSAGSWGPPNLLHASRREVHNHTYDSEAELLKSVAKQAGVIIIEDLFALEEATTSGVEPFLDHIHLASEGQRTLTSLMLKYLNSRPPFGAGPKERRTDG